MDDTYEKTRAAEEAHRLRAEEEELVTVPISDLERLFGGNRAQRRKFLSVLRKKVKASKKPNG